MFSTKPSFCHTLVVASLKIVVCRDNPEARSFCFRCRIERPRRKTGAEMAEQGEVRRRPRAVQLATEPRVAGKQQSRGLLGIFVVGSARHRAFSLQCELGRNCRNDRHVMRKAHFARGRALFDGERPMNFFLVLNRYPI